MKTIKEFRLFSLRFTKRILCIAILSLFISAVALAGKPCECTQQTVVGTYAWSFEATLIMTLEDGTKTPVLPARGLFIAFIDAEGNISAPGYAAFGDQIMRFGIEPGDPPNGGKITVNPDCTGKIELISGPTLEAIVHPQGDEINSIMIDGTPLFEAPTITGRWKRLSRVSDINRLSRERRHPKVGTYIDQSKGFNINPELAPGPIPSALLGVSSTRLDGTVEFRGTKVVAGNAIPITFADGEFEEGELPYTSMVTASIMTAGDTYLGEYEGWFVFLDNGNELWSISLYEAVGSPVVLGISKRISMQPSDLE